MIYIKSILVGTVTFGFSVGIYVMIWVWSNSRTYAALRKNYPNGEIGFDLSSLIYSPLFWLIAVSGFALGFVWEFRRANH